MIHRNLKTDTFQFSVVQFFQDSFFIYTSSLCCVYAKLESKQQESFIVMHVGRKSFVFNEHLIEFSNDDL